MLRLLKASPSRPAHLLVCGALACNAAAPIDVGLDYAEPASSPDEPEGGAPSVAPIMGPGQQSSSDFEDLLPLRWERGPIDDACNTSFHACGGLLAGTWVVVDNCNPEIRSREVLLEWAEERMNLDETACANAVQRIRWNWSGELIFEAGTGKVFDRRTRQQQVDMQLTASCLSATFGIPETDGVPPVVCDSLTGETMTCALAGGVCMCSNLSVSRGGASGTYFLIPDRVAIEAIPNKQYEYCVEGDTLLWREAEGPQRHVVLRRTVPPPPGTMDPVEPMTPAPL